MVSDGDRDIVFGKPKRIARDIEEHGSSDLQGGGRGFEPLSAHLFEDMEPCARRESCPLSAARAREKAGHLDDA